jgi:hypothetical protein
MKWVPVIVAEFALSASLVFQVSTSALASEVASSSSNELMRLQTAYDDALKKLATEQAKAVVNLQGQYTTTLTSLEKKAQEAGKLDLVVVIRKERDRFSTGKTMEDKDISQDTPELVKVQNNYVNVLREMPLGKARDTIKLAQQLNKALATLEQNLTRKGDTISAVEVRNVRDSLNNRPEVSEANVAIAGADANKPKEPEQVQPPPVKTARTSQPSNKVDKATSPPGAKKYTGKTPPYIKQRYLKLYEAVSADDKKSERELVDPNYLKKEGEGAVDTQVNYIFGFVQLMKMTSNSKVKVDAMKVKVDDQETMATLIPKLFFYNKWNEQPVMYWIQVDGDWYLDIYTDIKKNANSRTIVVGYWSTTRSR